MSRFSAISLLFTVLSILIWATQVNTPLHSDLSLRTVEVLPPVYPLLTISGPSPSARSQCIGNISSVNGCGTAGKTSWTSKVASAIKLSHSHIRACINRAGNYAHRVYDKLGRPTPKQLVGLLPLPTTSWFAPPAFSFIHVDKAKVLRPTRTSPDTTLPTRTRTIDSSTPAIPEPSHTRPLNMNPVVEVRVEAGERVMQRWFIGAAFVLTFASLLGTLVVAPPLVKPVDRCESSRDTRNYRCDVDSAVLSTAALVHLSHETERRNLIQNTTSRPAIKDPLPQLYLIVALSVLAHSESIGGASNRVLGLVVWRMPLFTSNNVVSTILQPHTRVSRRTMFSIDMVYRTRATESSGQLFTKRRTPLLGWHPVDGGREISPSYMRGPTRTGAHSLPPTILYSFNQLYAQPTSLYPYLNLRTLVLSKQPSVLLPEEVRLGVAPHHRLCIEWHAPVPAVEQPANISDKELEDAQSLLCQYESYRPPDLGKYPPEERTRVQNREIRLAQKLQEKRKRKDAKEGKVKVKPEPPAWMAVWMEMMKHGCIPAGKERPEEWALSSIARWEGTKELKGGRARKKVMWADEV